MINTIEKYFVRNKYIWNLLCTLFCLFLLVRTVSEKDSTQSINFLLLILIMSIAVLFPFFRTISLKKVINDFIIIFCVPLVYMICCFVIWKKYGYYQIGEFIRINLFLVFVILSKYIPVNKNTLLYFKLLIFTLLAICTYQVLTHNYYIVGNNLRLRGVLVHPNPFGLLLVMFSVFSFISYIKGFGKIWLLFGLLLVLFYTQVSNGGAMLFLFTFIFLQMLNKYGIKGIFVFSLIGSFLIIILYFISSNMHSRIDQFINVGILPRNAYPETSLQWRFFMWAFLLARLKDSFIIGFGPGSTMALHVKADNFDPGDPHNEVLRILFEYGIIGTVIVISLIKYYFDKLQSKHSKIIIISFIISCLFDNFFRATLLLMLVLFVVQLTEYVDGKKIGLINKINKKHDT